MRRAGGLDKMFGAKAKNKDAIAGTDQMKQKVAQMVGQYEKQHGAVRPYPVKK